MASDDSFDESPCFNRKRALRSGNSYKPIPSPVLRAQRDDLSESPDDNSFDHWFQCSGFATLTQGATEAEIEDDLARIHAGILTTDTGARHGKIKYPLRNRLATKARARVQGWSSDEATSFSGTSPSASGEPPVKSGSSPEINERINVSHSTRLNSFTAINLVGEGGSARKRFGDGRARKVYTNRLLVEQFGSSTDPEQQQ